MFDETLKTAIRRAARAADLDAAALFALVEVESGGRFFVAVDGRTEPPIRFEGHYFDRRLQGTARATAQGSGLASPVAGAVANPRSQAARWALLERAAAIDRKAAYESTSWGLGQVMGAHWAWLGFADVEALVAEARSGFEGQLRLMLRYIDKAGLAPALRGRDWAAFARGYNGPGYRRNAYDRKLAAAYRRHAGLAADRSVGSKENGLTAPSGPSGAQDLVSTAPRQATTRQQPTGPLHRRLFIWLGRRLGRGGISGLE